MKLLILRHGEAEHLLENWNKKISYQAFVDNIYRWEDVHLTEKGIRQCKKVAEKLIGQYDVIFSSPLERTKETTHYVNISNRTVHFEEELKEILITPPQFLKHFMFSINVWIFFCILKSLCDGSAFSIIRQIKELYHLFYMSGEKNILIVSHSARIHALLLYAVLSSLWKVKKKDISPCGLSIVEFSLEIEPLKQKKTIMNDL
ncbi:MAG: histidine phosphatase family protein [Candidatus Cloacimonetes bacterium]|nr:histidine phosphatase family protein [Candidatus Cloacimonadota bacterium]HPM01072.1 histidine phosphatase family protein [Candidatus Cloacimonadota bacterium]